MNRIATALSTHLKNAQRQYGIGSAAAKLIFIAPYVILAVFFLFMSLPSTQDFTELMTHRKYPIEWAMFFAFLVAGIMSLRLGWRLKRRGEPATIWLFYIIFAIGLLWTAGEVNAWGQKFFEFHTPAWMHRINAQHEMTMHNIEGWQGHNHWLRFAFAIGGFVGISLQKSPRYRKIAAPAILFSWFLVIAFKCGLDFWTKDFLHTSSYSWVLFIWIVNRVSKIVKLMIGITALLYVWLNGREQQAEKTT